MKKLTLFLCVLRSAAITKTESIIVNYNSLVIKICLMLEDLGYISGFTVLDKTRLKLFLRFHKNSCVFRTINLFSKPSSRTYLKFKNLKKKQTISHINSLSFTILTTPHSPLFSTDLECVLMHSGGEPILVVS